MQNKDIYQDICIHGKLVVMIFDELEYTVPGKYTLKTPNDTN